MAQITRGGKEMGMKEIREPTLAGSWYPGDAGILSRDVKRYLGNVKNQKVEGEIVALVSPHAGYVYSGQVAAYAYKLVEGTDFDSVIVIGPSHRYPFKGASLWAQGGFRTPLGVVPVDAELSKKLMEKRKEIRFIPEAHHQENSL
jgi:AmmeMemoRadiSam system protein B